MPSDVALKSTNGTHRALLKLSFGRPGWSFSGMPALELTTIGRRSGQSRAVMLGAPEQSMQARVATPDERARMWPQIAGKYKNYAGYQRRPSVRFRLCCSNLSPERNGPCRRVLST